MKQFNVYVNPQNQYKAVKIGWSWPGFFFGIIWALTKKMWAVAGIVFGVVFVIGMISSGMPESVSQGLNNIVALACSILIGYQGNIWYESNLTSRGYEMKDIITAASNEAAIAVYIKGSK